MLVRLSVLFASIQSAGLGIFWWNLVNWLVLTKEQTLLIIQFGSDYFLNHLPHNASFFKAIIWISMEWCRVFYGATWPNLVLLPVLHTVNGRAKCKFKMYTSGAIRYKIDTVNGRSQLQVLKWKLCQHMSQNVNKAKNLNSFDRINGIEILFNL